MKKRIITILLILTFFNGFSQKLDMCQYCQSKVFRIRAWFKDIHSNKKRWEMGNGIILNGKYFATCYHIIAPKPNEKLMYIEAIYNEKKINNSNKISYDSVFLTPNFKATKNQYDFSKHIYDSTNYETDFVVLKLIKPIKKTNYSFATINPSYGENLYCNGNSIKNGLVMNACQNVIFSLRYKQLESQKATFLGCIVTYTDGFSGSFIFNNNGEILGMIQFCMRTVPIDFIKEEYNRHKMSADLANKIVLAYQQGLFLQYSIDINFLINTYLKGYLN